jgi:hypothetical protein
MNTNVILELSKNEALVLFDWLKRFNEREDSTFEDQAEERALWNLEAILEKVLTVPFSSNYLDSLKEARNAIRDDE